MFFSHSNSCTFTGKLTGLETPPPPHCKGLYDLSSPELVQSVRHDTVLHSTVLHRSTILGVTTLHCPVMRDLSRTVP
jgi:hypothetical protein